MVADMQKKLAEKIVANILKANNIKLLETEVQLVINGEDKIVRFHQWANNRKHIGVFKILLPGNEIYYLAFIKWRKDDDYYAVIFDSNRTGPLAELHEIKSEYNGLRLSWKYSPRKRDKKNKLRKDYFKRYWGDIEVNIRIPNEATEVEKFLQDLVALVRNRIKADKLREQA